MEIWHTGRTRLWRLTEDGPELQRNIEVLGVSLHETKVTFGATMPCDLLVSFPEDSDWVVTLPPESPETFIESDVIMKFRKCLALQGNIGPMTCTAPSGIQAVGIAVVAYCDEGMWIK